MDETVSKYQKIGQSEWDIQNQVFITLIVFYLNVLIQIETNSKRKVLKNKSLFKE